MPKRFTPQKVLERVASYGHTWLQEEEYVNDTTVLTIKCKCGKKKFNRTLNCLLKSNAGCDDCTTEQRDGTMIERYGCLYAMQNEEVKAQARQTNMDRYGYKNPGLVPKFQAKQRATMMERHGVPHPMASEKFRQKQRDTLMRNHGVDNPLKSPAIREKIRKTCMERYGVDNPMKFAAFFDKAMKAFKKKPYTLPSGRIAELQGYENLTLDQFFAEGYTEDDFVVDDRENIPTIDFEYKGRWCKFYPDTFIKPCEWWPRGLIIETKSTFTFRRWRRKNMFKYYAALDAGYDMCFWIYDKKHELTKLRFMTIDSSEEELRTGVATVGEWNDDIVDEIYVKVGDRYVLENDVTPEDAAELVEEIANEIMYDEAAEEYIKELTDETADGYDPDIAVAVTI